jgi:hypothetical protein
MLMKMHLANGWVQIFATVFVAGGLSLLIDLQSRRETLFRWPAWAWMAAAGALVVLVIAIFSISTGTPAASLWDGVVIAPMRHPGVILSPIDWRPGTFSFALLALVLAVVDRMLIGRIASRGIVVATLRLLGGLAVLAQLTGWGHERPYQAVFQYAPALAWLMVTPLQNAAQDTGARGRSWLAWCGIWQLLQAYPVSGSQMMWGSFLFVPLLVTGCYDAICHLGTRLNHQQWAPRAAIAIFLAMALIANTELAASALDAYTHNEPLGLPGARTLRLSPRFTSDARVISRNAAAHAGILFTTPGMWSFNIWSQKPTPTSANTTIWQVLLNEDQKHAIIKRLLEEPKSMVISRGANIYNPENYLDSFHPVVSVGHYQLWARKDRPILPLGTVELRRSNDGRAFLIFAADPTEHPIAAAQIRTLNSGEVVARSSVEASRSWKVLPVDLQAKPTGPTSSPDKPFPLPQYSLIQVEITGNLPIANPDDLEAVLTDSTGTILESFRFNKARRE